MPTQILAIVGQIAGIGGLALGVFLIIYKCFIQGKSFSTLTSLQSYKIFKMFLILVFVITFIGISAWVISIWINGRTPVQEASLGKIFVHLDTQNIDNTEKSSKDTNFKLTLDTQNIDGFKTTSLTNGKKAFTNGVKFKLIILNTGDHKRTFNSMDLILVKYRPAVNAVINKPRIDIMKFGDVRTAHLLHIKILPTELTGFWRITEEGEYRQIKPTTKKRLKLLSIDDGSELNLTVAPNDSEVFNGSITTQYPGIYKVSFEISYLDDSGKTNYIRTEEMEIKNGIFTSNINIRPSISVINRTLIKQEGPLESDDVLGPAGLLKIAEFWHAITGKRATILVNENYDLGDLLNLPIQTINPLLMLLIIERASNPSRNMPLVLLVSDGYTSHVISPIKVTKEKSMRLYYSDPWYDYSFLEHKRNVAGTNARREGKGIFSIGYDDYLKVAVAIVFVRLDDDEKN